VFSKFSFACALSPKSAVGAKLSRDKSNSGYGIGWSLRSQLLSTNGSLMTRRCYGILNVSVRQIVGKTFAGYGLAVSGSGLGERDRFVVQRS
jgi:hypothetical protein